MWLASSSARGALEWHRGTLEQQPQGKLEKQSVGSLLQPRGPSHGLGRAAAGRQGEARGVPRVREGERRGGQEAVVRVLLLGDVLSSAEEGLSRAILSNTGNFIKAEV